MDLYDKLKQKLSSQQYIRVLEFIARGNFSLEKLQQLENACQNNIKHMVTDLNDTDRYLSGIPLSILAKIRRIDEKFRTSDQQSLLDRYSSEEMEQQCSDFRRVQNEFLLAENDNLALIREIRQIFLELYPEAPLSPRLSRRELETSPTRAMGKFHSFPSPKNSPRNLLGDLRKPKEKN